jgi:hypothetical protein
MGHGFDGGSPSRAACALPTNMVAQRMAARTAALIMAVHSSLVRRNPKRFVIKALWTGSQAAADVTSALNTWLSDNAAKAAQTKKHAP